MQGGDDVPSFSYQALNRAGRRLRGTVKVFDEAAATSLLREQGLYVLKLKQQGDDVWWKREIYFGRKVSAEEFAMFCRQLATLIRAGVTILESVRVMAEQAESKPLRKALGQVTQSIAQGRQLSDAVAETPDIFPVIFVNMVHAGEVAGNLDDVLDRMARFFEKSYYLREKVKSALAYPLVVGSVSIMVTVFLLVKIVPTFVGIFASYHAQLPLPTRIVLGVSNILEHDWWIILAVIAALVIGNKVLNRRRTWVRFKDRLKLRLPVFGVLIQKSVVARMARTLSSLFASAVPIVQSLKIVSEIVGNTVVADALMDSVASLQGGQSLAGPIAKSRLFPPLVAHMITIGEQTGNLDFMLEKIADFYEAEVETYADRLKSLLEPTMILVLATIVGTIVTAVLLPSFSLISHMGGA